MFSARPSSSGGSWLLGPLISCRAHSAAHVESGAPGHMHAGQHPHPTGSCAEPPGPQCWRCTRQHSHLPRTASSQVCASRSHAAASPPASTAAWPSEAPAHLVDVLADLGEHGVRLVAQRISCFLQYLLQRAHLCVELLHHEALPLQGGEWRRTVSNDVASMSTCLDDAALGCVGLLGHKPMLIAQLIDVPERQLRCFHKHAGCQLCRCPACTSARCDKVQHSVRRPHIIQEAHAVAAEDGEEETQHREEAVLERRDRRPAPDK